MEKNWKVKKPESWKTIKWSSPIVVSRKSDGDIRIYGDYRIDVNHKVCSDSYPKSNVEVAIHALAGLSIFTKIDQKTIYHQIPRDKYFKEVTTINTPIGLLKWKRMPYGIKTVSAIFQRAIEQVLGEDIKNMVCYQDDICIGATNENELKKKTDIVLNRLRNAGMTKNDSSKIPFFRLYHFKRRYITRPSLGKKF